MVYLSGASLPRFSWQKDVVVVVLGSSSATVLSSGAVLLSICLSYTRFVQTLESPGITTLRFQAWKALEQGMGPRKPWKSPGVLKNWSWIC